MSTLTPPFTPHTTPPPNFLPPTHTHPSLRHASLRHTTTSNESLRPPPIRIARRPLSTVPAYRTPSTLPALADLERARKTPDRTFLAPRVWDLWGKRGGFEDVDEGDEEETHTSRASSRSPSLPPFPFESPCIPPSPLSLVLAADEIPYLLTAQPVSMRTVSVSSSQPPFPVLRHTSRFTEHLGVSGEAMWASGIDFEGAGLETVEGFREGEGNDGQGGGEKEDEEEDSGDGEERREKKRKWWKWKGVGARWIQMTGFLRRKVEEGRGCEGVSPRVV